MGDGDGVLGGHFGGHERHSVFRRAAVLLVIHVLLVVGARVGPRVGARVGARVGDGVWHRVRVGRLVARMPLVAHPQLAAGVVAVVHGGRVG